MLMRRLSLWLKVLATGSLTMLLSACYGTITTLAVMYGAPVTDVRGSVKTVRKGDKGPLPGIEISYTQGDPTDFGAENWKPLGSTDETGMLDYELTNEGWGNFSVKAEDTDGPANGGEFETLVVEAVDEAVEILEMDPKVP